MDLSEFLRYNNIKDEKNLFDHLSCKGYDWGYLSAEKKKEKEKDIYSKLWTLKSTEDIIEDKMAICWDYANFEKKIFDHMNLKSFIYQIIFDDDIETNQSHCFTIIEKDDGYMLFEYSFRRNAGIYMKRDINEIIEMIWIWVCERLDHMRNKNVAAYRFNGCFPE